MLITPHSIVYQTIHGRPPPKAFPIIWISIGFLRTIASSLIYETTGTLLCAPILALYLHLSIGDTWNTIASVEDRTGAAVPGVVLVWLSVVYAVRRYHETLPLAGKVRWSLAGRS